MGKVCKRALAVVVVTLAHESSVDFAYENARKVLGRNCGIVTCHAGDYADQKLVDLNLYDTVAFFGEEVTSQFEKMCQLACKAKVKIINYTVPGTPAYAVVEQYRDIAFVEA